MPIYIPLAKASYMAETRVKIDRLSFVYTKSYKVTWQKAHMQEAGKNWELRGKGQMHRRQWRIGSTNTTYHSEIDHTFINMCTVVHKAEKSMLLEFKQTWGA